MNIEQYVKNTDQFLCLYESLLQSILSLDIDTIPPRYNIKLFGTLNRAYTQLYKASGQISTNFIRSFIKKDKFLVDKELDTVETNAVHSENIDYDIVETIDTHSEGIFNQFTEDAELVRFSSTSKLTNKLSNVSYILDILIAIQYNIQSIIFRLNSLSVKLECQLRFMENKLISLLNSLSCNPKIAYDEYSIYCNIISCIKEFFWFEDFESLETLKGCKVLFITKKFKNYHKFVNSSKYKKFKSLSGANNTYIVNKFINVLLPEIQNRIQLQLEKYQKLSADISSEQLKYKSDFDKLLVELSSLSE